MLTTHLTPTLPLPTYLFPSLPLCSASQPCVGQSLSCVQLSATSRTVAARLLSVHGDSPGKNTGVGCHAHLQGIFPTQGSNPPELKVDSLPAEPPGKSMNIEVGSLSLLQGIFLTQELNWGLLHFQADSLPAELPGKLSLELANPC